MNSRQIYTLDANDWASLQRQVKAALLDCWHQHAGRWQPQTISLHVATRLMPDTGQGVERNACLPQLVAWLRQQGHAVTVLGDHNLHEHRLYLNRSKIMGDS